MPAGGSHRSDACLARHQGLRFYVILISDKRIENGVPKNGKQKMTIFSDICTTISGYRAVLLEVSSFWKDKLKDLKPST